MPFVRTTRDLAHLVRDRRRGRGLSQQELAAAVGVSARFLSQLENGKETAEIGLVLRTLQALGVDLEVHGRPRIVPPAELEADDAVVDLEQILADHRDPAQRHGPAQTSGRARGKP